MDVAKMVARKDTVVKQNNDGILFLFKKNKVSFFHGRGSFGGGEGALRDQGGRRRPCSRPSTSSSPPAPRPPAAGPGSTKTLILSNDGAAHPAVPKKLGVIGSGVIGLEMGSVWRRLGAEVTILEACRPSSGGRRRAVAKEAKKAFVKQGLTSSSA